MNQPTVPDAATSDGIWYLVSGIGLVAVIRVNPNPKSTQLLQ